MTSRSAVRRNAVMQYGYVAARYVFPLLTLPYLARVLGPEEYGVRAYIVSLMLFLQTISDYGFNLSGAKRIVKSLDDATRCSRIMSSIVAAKVLLLTLLMLVAMFVTATVPLISDEGVCVTTAFLGVAFNTLMPDFLFIGKENMGVITSRFVVSKTASTALIFLLVRSPEDLELAFALETLGSVIAFAMSWKRGMEELQVKIAKPVLGDVFQAISDATPFFMANVSVAAFNALATMAVGVCLGDARQVAYWSLSVTALNAVLSLYNPIANALYPHMVHAKDLRLFRKLFIAGTAGALLAALLFSALSNLIVAVLGGEGYEEGSYILALLSPVLFLAYPALLLGSPLLGAFERERELATASALPAALYALALGAICLSGSFTIHAVAACRVGAEALLLAMRALFAWKCVRQNVPSEKGDDPIAETARHEDG